MKDFCTIAVIAEEGPEQLKYFLKHYRDCYPSNPVHIISDGIDNQDYNKLCKQYNADYTLGRYYKRIECGGLWWNRTITAGLNYNTKWMLKVDPDTRFWRQFKTEPQFAISGTHNNIGLSSEYIQGGCQAIRRDAAQQIINNGILESGELTKYWNFCPNKKYRNSWVPTGYFTTDFSLVYIMRKLGIEFGDWAEIGAQWRVAPPNFNDEYAVTHPHKINDAKKIGVSSETPITIITTCKGRKHHLEQTLPLWLDEENVNVVVVDYNCPQKTGNWVERNFKDVRIARVHNEHNFHLARARNVGAKYAPQGWWCFMDADIVIKPGWANRIRSVLADNYYYVASPLQWGLTGTCVLKSSDYYKAGGYDEVMAGWGSEDLDFYTRLRQVNVRPAFWDGKYAEPIKHSDAERIKFYTKQKSDSAVLNGKYVQAKNKLIISTWELPNLDTRKKLWESISCDSNDHKDEDPNNYYPSDDMAMTPQKAPKQEETKQEETRREEIRHGSSSTSYEASSTSIRSSMVRSVKTTPPVRSQMMNISVLNHSTIDIGMSLDELCQVGMTYLDLLSQHWPGTEARLIPTTVILPNTHAIIIMDDSDHNSNDLGYPNLTPDGFPLAKVFAKQEMVQGVPLTVTFTHELGEFRVDPFNNMSATAKDGTAYMLDVADPVEDDWFLLDGYTVANFVLKPWFESFRKPGSCKFDYMGLLNGPFVLSNGGFATVKEQHEIQWHEIFCSHPKREQLTAQDQREWRNDVRKKKCHASTRLAHGAYLKDTL